MYHIENQETQGVIVPSLLRKVGIYLLNILLFIIYYLAFAFTLGLIIGLVLSLAGTSQEAIGASIASNSSLINLSLFIIMVLTIIFHKHFYLGTTTRPQAPQQTPPSLPQT